MLGQIIQSIQFPKCYVFNCVFESSGALSQYCHLLEDKGQKMSASDQTIHTFFFTFTPMLLEELCPQRNRAEKRNFEIKFRELGKEGELMIPMVYSDNLQKYGVTRGLVKIYDVMKDGFERISCVAAITTEQVLKATETDSLLIKNIGKLKLTLKCSYRQYSSKKQIRSSKSSLDKENESFHQNLDVTSNIKQHMEEPSNEEEPLIIDDSFLVNRKLQQIPSSHSSYFEEDIKRQELELVGEQLIEERRRVSVLESKLEQSTSKKHNIKKSLQQKKQEIKEYLFHFKKLVSCLEIDSRGKYKLEIDELTHQVCLNFKVGINIETQFLDFLTFMTNKLKEAELGSYFYRVKSPNSSSEEENSESLKLRIFQLQEKQAEQTKKVSIAEKKICQMQKQKKEREELINNYEETLIMKNDLILKLEEKIRKLVFKKMALTNLNTYFKEKESQLDDFLAAKEQNIGYMRKALGVSAQQLDALEFRNNKLKEIVKNLQFTIEEMKEENENLIEMVQTYRQKFGALRSTKDKVLQLQIKECIQWIEHQSRDFFLHGSESSISEEPPFNLLSVLRNTSNLSHFSKQDISNIRKEALNLIQTIDETKEKILY